MGTVLTSFMIALIILRICIVANARLTIITELSRSEDTEQRLRTIRKLKEVSFLKQMSCINLYTKDQFTKQIKGE